MQAMGLTRLGSPATVHRRIARLRKIGMVTTDEDANDTRIKRLVLTPTAVTHFEKLGESLKSVTGSAMA
jgi:DNA-binding MarR family transcriptional regulator